MHETAVTATNYLQGGVLFSRRVIRSKVAAARLNCRLHVAEHSLPAWLIIFFVGLLSMPGLPLSTNNGGIAMRSVMRRHSHFEIKYAKQTDMVPEKPEPIFSWTGKGRTMPRNWFGSEGKALNYWSQRSKFEYRGSQHFFLLPSKITGKFNS